jgi:hypothetical protein
MEVRCVEVPDAPDGTKQDYSYWVTVGKSYTVTSILIKNSGRNSSLQIVDNDRSLGIFDAKYFVTVDETIPSNWVIRLRPSGVMDLGPASWLEWGFWEAYYDDDPAAVAAVRLEVDRMGIKDLRS